MCGNIRLTSHFETTLFQSKVYLNLLFIIIFYVQFIIIII